MKLSYKLLSMIIAISLLLTGSILPITASALTDDNDSPNEIVLDEEILKSEDITLTDKAVLRAEDSAISEESMILKYIDSSQFNAAKHVQRLTEQEDLNTYVFANADGTRSIYMMNENVKYVDEDGTVREKDISLKSKTDGFGIVQSNVELLIPNNPVQGIDLEYSGFAIKLIPQGLINTVSAVQSDNSVVYDEAYGENTKLVYTPTLSGVKEDIVLSEYAANATYSFVLETDGLFVYNGDSGYYLADDGKAEPIFYLGEIVIYDAVGKPADGTMTVEEVTAGEKYLLTVTADDDFLSDPTTVYPVTIDPSITFSDSTTTGSIIDSPVFEGYPAKNFGTYVYNRVGTPSEAYGIGRTVVKLSGLTSSNEYQTITANQITNVTFYAKEASGGNTHYINLYPLTSNTTWTESTVTWNNVGSFNTSANYGNTMYNNQWTAFNITDLVKGWKNGTYSADAGFIMTNENEANNKCFYASEYSTASYRPYVTMTYETAISLNYSSTSIVEGGTKTLTATTKPSGQTVNWSTSNSTIATVSSSGVVTANKAGSVTITASFIDADEITRTATCTVYVYVANGVYYIKNLNSNYYLHVKTGQIDNFSDVYQYFKYSSSKSNNYKIRQMWKTYYLGNGRYSIRPMNKLDKGLDVTSGNVDIYNIGTSDTLDSVPSYGEWTISWYSTGYVFKNNGSDSKTMQIENASTSSGATVVASTYSTSTNCRWGLTTVSSPPAGAYLFDKLDKTIVSTVTRALDVGTSKSLSSLQICAVAYSGTNTSQSFTWYTSNSSIATVDSTGSVTGIATGKATITGRVYRNGSYQYVSYTVCVGYPALFSSLVNSNTITTDKLDQTDDGFFLTTTPISTILGRKGISYLPVDSDYSAEWYVNYYFDDWYLFAVKDGTSVSYGLYKMREQETDSYDGNDPGVTVSFIGLDGTKLTTCFNNKTNENRYALYQALTKVTGPGSYDADEIITGYFSDTSSDGAYLIAEKSVIFFANRVSGNTIVASDNLISIFAEIAEIDELLGNIYLDSEARLVLIRQKADLQRIPNALKAINDASGRIIFDFDDYTINVQNKNSLTLYERQAILACFTGDVTFNSFATEVEFHAEAVDDWKKIFDWWYDAAIRADMAVGEEYESGFYDEYYDLESSIVRAQAAAHGEY